MRKWHTEIDPQTIPTEVLLSEMGRRNSAKRKVHSGGSGRPKVLRPCPRCRVMLGAVEMRKHSCS